MPMVQGRRERSVAFREVDVGREVSRVFVLGAGASCSYTESPTGLRPPLAKEIIRTFQKLDISENRLVLVGNILNYVRDTRGIPPEDFGSWDEDLETFFSDVDEEVNDISQRLLRGNHLTDTDRYRFGQSTGAYSQLIFLFASILNEIQNGPVSIPHMLLAADLVDTDAIITFNWDTLMDRALYAAQKWSPSSGYSIRPEAVFDDGWKAPDESRAPGRGPLYVKLHGSTNWLAPFHGRNYATGQQHVMSRYGMDKLYVFLKASKAYDTYEGRYWGPYDPVSYCYYPPSLPLVRDDLDPGHVGIRLVVAPDLDVHGKVVTGEEGVFSMPLIVPPIRNKQYARYGRLFKTLWGLAGKCLAECSELYVVGYSFPRTDVATRKSFLDALSRNAGLERVVIIDPFPEGVAEVFLREFRVAGSLLEIRKEGFGVESFRSGGHL